MLPRVQPIAPVRAKAPFDDPEWLFDLKYDGFRALAYLEQELFKRLCDPSDVAAIFVEPIQGEGGYLVAPPEFLQGLDQQKIYRKLDGATPIRIASE